MARRPGTAGQFSRWGLHSGTAPRGGARRRNANREQARGRLGTPTSGQFSRWGPARAGLRPAHGASVSGGVVPLPARTPPAEPAKCRRSRACKSLRRVAWALRRAPSPNCTFVTGRVCGPTRSWTFRCPPGSDAGQRPPPGELAGAPWRKRVGIEPTIPGTNPESTDLKSAEAARPHALPVRCSGLPRTAGRDPGGADGDRTRDLVNAIHARSQLRHSPSPGHPERTECIALGSASRPLEWEPRCGRQEEAACPFRMILGRVATLNVTM